MCEFRLISLDCTTCPQHLPPTCTTCNNLSSTFSFFFFFLNRSKSKSPRRKKRTPSPKPTKLHIGRLTRNVNKDHLTEIFSMYGSIKSIDMPVDRFHSHISKGMAYIEYDKHEEAEKAKKHMDGGR